MLLATLLLNFAAQPAQENGTDVITLTSGKKITGVLLVVNDEEVVLGNGSKRKSYPRKKVAEVSGPRADYSEYIEKLNALFADGLSAQAATDLAAWAADHGFTRDVQLLNLAALSVDADFEAAHLALGHKLISGKWKAKNNRGTRVSWSKVIEQHSEFSKGWEVTTSHFEIVAGCNLQQVVLAGVELEQLYATFYQQFQMAGGFFELQQPIKVHIYQSHKAFPSISNNGDAYWDNAPRILVSYINNAGEPSRLLHEACHAIMEMSARELGRKQANFPGWLLEGIATWMEHVFTGEAGAPNFDPQRCDVEKFKLHHNANKPDSLTRVLNYGLGDFLSSTGQHRRYAQSYSLVHFFMTSDFEDVHQQFMGFLSSAWDGKGSTSHFKKSFGKKLDKLEEAWIEFVEKIATQ